MRKIIAGLFTVSFILTGCGIDSIFNGGFTEWLFCFLVTAACGFVLFGGQG